MGKLGEKNLLEHPKPVSWRPSSNAMRAFYLEIGGARWLKRILNELMSAKKP